MRRALNRVNARVNRAALDLLSVRPDDRLLDVGFGGGLILQEALLRLPRGAVAGIEISEPMLELARRKFRREMAAGRLEVKEGSVSSIPYPDDSFHRVTAVNTLHFWPDPAGGLREVLRVMKPGGRVVIVLRPKEYLERIRFTSHGFTAYDDHQLRGLLVGAGFGAVHVERREDAHMGMQLAMATKPHPGAVP
ncbi:MAG TPA: class I SAM-dependent methyltransferase [Vicinamibacteria bacterium]|nr:class I SAM-dependent methyltransferase [Vicinamibacteria bacterium]